MPLRNMVQAEQAVQRRYSAGARHPEVELCCPVSCDPRLLEAIPRDVLERDYGCGDPSRHIRPGEIVLDLGSGAGKSCFIASQVVGPAGHVIGIDMTDEMLGVARRNAPELAARIGYSNVEFKKVKIQDLALDLGKLGCWHSITVAAYKGKQGPCWEWKQAVVYRGPFQRVEDDDGHVLRRGVRTAVCDKTFQIDSQEPYRSHFELIPPRIEVPREEAPPFPCATSELRRDPKETKGEDYRLTTEARGACCAPKNGKGSCC